MKPKTKDVDFESLPLNERLNLLEAQHLDILQSNDWVDTPESKKIESLYTSLNTYQKCYECGGRYAKVTCQYH